MVCGRPAPVSIVQKTKIAARRENITVSAAHSAR